MRRYFRLVGRFLIAILVGGIVEQLARLAMSYVGYAEMHAANSSGWVGGWMAAFMWFEVMKKPAADHSGRAG